MTIDEILTLLKGARQVGSGQWVARCPAHDDRNPSLSIAEGEDGRILLHCFAGCSVENICSALGIEVRDLYPGGEGYISTRNTIPTFRPEAEKRTNQGSKTTPPNFRPFSDLPTPSDHLGLTLEELAEAKKLPVDFLKSVGLSTIHVEKIPCVRIPYLGENGEELATRFRLALDGGLRFRWKQGSRIFPYGLWRLGEARELGWILLVEGESDCWTLWMYGIPALGIPGKTTWKSSWAQYLENLAVYIWQEPEAEDFATRIGKDIPGALIIPAPDGIKDPSEAHLQGKNLREFLGELKKQAIPVRNILEAHQSEEAQKLAEEAKGVLDADDPLQLVEEAIIKSGYGGDIRYPLILYLAMTSRLLHFDPGQLPVHLALRCAPSGGKSYTLNVVKKLLPEEAIYTVDAGSPRAFIFDPQAQDLKFRAFIFSESDSIPTGEDNPVASAVRTLLSDGVVSYKIVEKNGDGRHETRTVVREGPTVFITTTTRGLGEQLSTRLFVLDIPEDRERLREILLTQADIELHGVVAPDEKLIAFQRYLQSLAPWRVAFPFVYELAENIPHASPRVTRDFPRLLALIKTVALLRHRHRERDGAGRIVATLEDYATIFELCGEMYRTSACGVSRGLRELVEKVREFKEKGKTATYALLAKELGLSSDTVRKRAKVALENGWLVNVETKMGKPAKLEPGDPLPEEIGLPHPEKLLSPGGRKVGKTPENGGNAPEASIDADSGYTPDGRNTYPGELLPPPPFDGENGTEDGDYVAFDLN